MRNRVIRMFNAWYQPEVRMTQEEWTYVGAMLLAWVLAFDLGLLIGFIIS